MERYSEYKASGIEWIGEIPSEWEICRISALYEQRNEKVSDKDYQPLSVTMQGIVPQLETAAKTQDGDNRKLVKAGDFAINSRSDRRGSCGISPLDGSVSLITNVLAPIDRSKMDDRYYGLLYQSEGFSDEYYRWGTGIVDDLWSTNWSRMKNILVPVPPVSEQSKVSGFLGEKAAETDELIASQEKSIELLQEYRKAVISEAVTKGLDPKVPMKDSGVDWIGEIPEGYKIARLKNLGILTKGNGIKKDDVVPVGRPCVRYGELYSTYGMSLEQPISFIPEELYKNSEKLFPGDLLFALTGENEEDIGRALINESKMDIAYGGDTVALSKPLVKGKLLAYAANSSYFNTQRTQGARGGIIVHLPLSWLSNCMVVVPPEAQQTKITKYLDSKTAEIDSLIADKQQLIDKLKEYHKSLISEAVTGKFKVPGVA